MQRKIGWIILFMLICIHNMALANSDFSNLISTADQLYKDYLITEDETQILKAKTILDSLMKDYPDNAEIFWKTARCYNEYAIFSDNLITTYNTAIDFAKLSIELADNAEAHFWLAILYGRIGQAKGLLNSLFLVKPMRDELEKCITLDPNYDYAYHVLATLYLKVPGKPLSIGDKKKALDYELKAIELVPHHFPYQWALYKIYKSLGRKAEAKEVLETILTLPLEYEFDQVYNEELTNQQIQELAAEALTD